MKALILVLVLALASVPLSSAQSDEEIVQFADDVLEISVLPLPVVANASINDDILIITGTFKPEAKVSTGYAGSAIYIMAMASEKLIERYPDRFSTTDLKLFDSNNTLVGEANIDAMIA
ncbi:MAG: hypothetical protein MUO26_09605 [Methanotrichaceae archaeon]|nr:hypothetical protein [Methanotrichaceae archaeon]